MLAFMRLTASLLFFSSLGVSPQGPAVAENGMVATSHPLAVDVGVQILRQGGTAVDAAIAVDAVLGVVEPMSCGIGGDLYVLLYDAKSKKLYGLNASGRSPLAATREEFAGRGLKEIPEEGPLSWSVPGCVDGWETLRARFGARPLTQLLQPAIDAAENGFVVTPVIGADWKHSESLLRRRPEAAAAFLKDGRAPAVREKMTNKPLAATYRRIAERGSREFYEGKIAEKIVEYSKKRGGLFSIEDFKRHRSTWVEPASTTYRGIEVYELPPPGQGIAALQMLNLLEAYLLKATEPNSVEMLHRFIEAKKLAFEDRARFYADPDFYKDAPIARLISKAYADERRKLIDTKRAATNVSAGDPKLVAGDTVYLTVVDRDRNAVSFIQSIYFGWGSGEPAGDLGFMLQNRGCLFALDDQHPNRLEPGKRPFHTIIPAMAMKDGKPWMSFGVMGGDMQPQGHVQVLVNIIDHGMDVQAAGAAPRVRHFGSSTPTGGVMQGGGKVILEKGIPQQVADELKRRGHDVDYGGPGNFGGYQAIRIDGDLLLGGSDPRKDGKADGY